jgi:hypothetical protein
MFRLRETPSAYLWPGILWTFVSIVQFVERKFSAGHLVFIAAAIIYYILAIIVFVKNKKRD